MKLLNEEILFSRIRAHAKQDLAEGKIGGAELIVNQCGKRVLHETFGSKTPGGPKLEKGLLYRAASMSKPIGAAAVVCLADQGKIDLYDPISDYLDGYDDLWVGRVENDRVVPDHRANGPCRIFQLLCHSSGIASDPLAVYQETWEPYDSLKSIAEGLAGQPIAFEPYTKTMYSSITFDLAARIVEVASGMAFPEFLRKYLFQPLGMTDTTFEPTQEQRARFIPIHTRAADGTPGTAEIPDKYVYNGIPMSCTSAGAGIAVTAEDYSRFAEMLCSGGLAPDGTRVLKEESVLRMRTPAVTPMIMPEPDDQLWGLGIRVVTKDSYPHGLKTGCFGWSGAYGSHFWVDPNNRITAVYMKNSYYDGGAGNRTACTFEEDVSAALGDFADPQ